MTENGNILDSKRYRRELYEICMRIKSNGYTSRERSLAITKIQEAIFWLGWDLHELGEANPYPHGMDDTNSTVDPLARELNAGKSEG